MSHCCNEMRFFIKENKINLEYDARFREYYITLKPRCGASRQLVDYCPWCAHKLPNDLRDKWFNILRTEYNLEDPDCEEENIPPEFRTDEWWKKRGL